MAEISCACYHRPGGRYPAGARVTVRYVTQAATLDALAKAANASVHLRQPGMKEAIDRLLKHRLAQPEHVARRKMLLAQTAELRKTAIKLPPGYEEQLKEIAGVSAATEQLRAALKETFAQSGLGEATLDLALDFGRRSSTFPTAQSRNERLALWLS